jgi:hypothetical protein
MTTRHTGFQRRVQFCHSALDTLVWNSGLGVRLGNNRVQSALHSSWMSPMRLGLGRDTTVTVVLDASWPRLRQARRSAHRGGCNPIVTCRAPRENVRVGP